MVEGWLCDGIDWFRRPVLYRGSALSWSHSYHILNFSLVLGLEIPRGRIGEMTRCDE